MKSSATNVADDGLELPLVVAYLCGCAVRQEVPDAMRLASVDVDEVMRLAKRHMLVSCVAAAFMAAGLGGKRMRVEVEHGMWRVMQIQADWELVRQGLEREGIWYCPLKGAVVKDLYPVRGMRQMSDFDVLFDASRAEDVRRIMEGLEFTCEHYGTGVHDVYHKPMVTNLEMHRALFSPVAKEQFAAFYNNVKDRLIKDDGNDFGWHMDVSECYLYLVAHEHKHFSASGTGLRSLLDVYVYLCAYGTQIDWEWVVTKAHELGIGEFEESNRELALRLFGGEALTNDDMRTVAYMAGSGTYGTLKNGVRNKVAENGGGLCGKVRYLGQRLFPPASYLAEAYPAYFRHKVTIPFAYLHRFWRGATVSRKMVAVQLRTLWDDEH